MDRIFVETTIQIQRLLHDPSTYSTIQSVLQTRKTVTSTYVWMEVQRTIGQDYQYLIDLLLTRKPSTFAQLMRHLGTGENIYSSRRLKRMLHIVAYWLEQLNTSAIEPIMMAYQLKRQRNRLLHQTFFEHIDQVVSPTMCDLIQPGYSVPSGGRMSCRREAARCSLHELLSQHESAIQTLQADSRTLNSLDANTKHALSEVISDFAMAKGEKNCWALGDVIISLECPSDAAIWTTNVRHFEPLCKVFGKQVFFPDSADV